MWVPLRGRLGEPLLGGGVALRNLLPCEVDDAKDALGIGVAVLRGPLGPLPGLHGVRLDALPSKVPDPKRSKTVLPFRT